MTLGLLTPIKTRLKASSFFPFKSTYFAVSFPSPHYSYPNNSTNIGCPPFFRTYHIVQFLGTTSGNQNPNNPHEPQDNGNNQDGTQNLLNGGRHGEETVYEPKKNTSNNQNHNYCC
jgi:hypothetical protein